MRGRLLVILGEKIVFEIEQSIVVDRRADISHQLFQKEQIK